MIKIVFSYVTRITIFLVSNGQVTSVGAQFGTFRLAFHGLKACYHIVFFFFFLRNLIIILFNLSQIVPFHAFFYIYIYIYDGFFLFPFFFLMVHFHALNVWKGRDEVFMELYNIGSF